MANHQFVRDKALLARGKRAFEVGMEVGVHCTVCRALEMLPVICDGCAVPLCKDCVNFHTKTCEHCSKIDLHTMPTCPICDQSIILPTATSLSETRRQRVAAIEARISHHIESGCKLFTPAAAKQRTKSRKRCKVKGCKNKLLLGGCVCDGCGHTFCMAHRFTSDHKCRGRGLDATLAQQAATCRDVARIRDSRESTQSSCHVF